MPIYEYFCPDNNTVYRFFARRMGLGHTVPRCPANPAFQMQKQVSAFAITGATSKAKREPGSGGGDDDNDGMDDPRMEHAMMEMEREMSSLDEENPDPRQMGRLMRRMSELTGEGGGDERMEEMIRRLESGEDPDKMEEEFGDVMGEDDGEGGGLPGEEDGSGGGSPGFENGGAKMLSLLRRRGHSMQRRRADPELYEMDDYL